MQLFCIRSHLYFICAMNSSFCLWASQHIVPMEETSGGEEWSQQPLMEKHAVRPNYFDRSISWNEGNIRMVAEITGRSEGNIRMVVEIIGRRREWNITLKLQNFFFVEKLQNCGKRQQYIGRILGLFKDSLHICSFTIMYIFVWYTFLCEYYLAVTVKISFVLFAQSLFCFWWFFFLYD